MQEAGALTLQELVLKLDPSLNKPWFHTHPVEREEER